MYKLNLTPVVLNSQGQPVMLKDEKTFNIRDIVKEIFAAPAYNPQGTIESLVSDVKNRYRILQLIPNVDVLDLSELEHNFFVSMLFQFRQPVEVINFILDNIIKTPEEEKKE